MITWEKVGSKFDYGANTSFSNGESLLYLTNANESISGNYIRIDSNGDSEGNFTAYALKPHNYTKVVNSVYENQF